MLSLVGSLTWGLKLPLSFGLSLHSSSINSVLGLHEDLILMSIFYFSIRFFLLALNEDQISGI